MTTTTTTKNPARGTGDPSAGTGTLPEGCPAPRGLLDGTLGPDRLACLAAVFADATAYRRPSGCCVDCEADGPTGALCPDHATDLDRAEGYAVLAAVLGIPLEDQ
jgi:hypothetical protein